jgi:DNA-directed RNA polymerase subunit K/omega
MPIKPIDIEAFTHSARNVHEAIVATSKRARQINEEIRIEFNQRVEVLTPRVETESEESDINPDQLRIAVEFEKRPKPTDLALEELMQGALQWRYKETEEAAAVKSEEAPADEDESEEE